MKITVEFDSEEEFKARIKNPRGAKGSTDDASEGQPAAGGQQQAPAPLMPPQGQTAAFQQSAAFAPPVSGPFPPLQPSTIDAVVASLVQRIVTRIDGAIASGQPADAVLTWFRGQCGAEASAATMDQIKTVFLPKLQVPGLENIAKLMNA